MEIQSSSELQSWVTNTQMYLMLANRVKQSQVMIKPGQKNVSSHFHFWYLTWTSGLDPCQQQEGR